MLSTQKNTEIILINSHITTALFAHYLFALLSKPKQEKFTILSYAKNKIRCIKRIVFVAKKQVVVSELKRSHFTKFTYKSEK